MITGRVSGDREARIPLIVCGKDGVKVALEAVIDTGFTGFLTLPPDLIDQLSLTWLTRGQALLGNGKIDEYDVYAGIVIWDGIERRILIDCADTDPLVGMELMENYELLLQAFVGGEVTIRRFIPPSATLVE